MKILAICGSLQSKSSNLTLIEQAIALAPTGVTITAYDGLRDLPQFNPDLEEHRELAVVRALRDAVSSSDALLIACPEYGHSLPGALKNAVDWLIGSGELERKIVAITAAVPHPDRGRRGLKALADTLGAVSARIVFGEPIVKGPTLVNEVGRLLALLNAEIQMSGHA